MSSGENVVVASGRNVPVDGDYRLTSKMGLGPALCFRTLPCGLCCSQIFEYSCCCRSVGMCGLPCMKRPGMRKALMVLALIMNLFALAATIVGACSLSMSDEVIRNTAWAHGYIPLVNSSVVSASGVFSTNFTDDVEIDLWLGLSGAAVTAQGKKTTQSEKLFRGWRDDKTCNAATGTNHHVITRYCENCQAAVLACFSTAIFGVVTMIPTIQTDYQVSGWQH